MKRSAFFLVAVGLALPVWAAETGGIEGRALIGSAPAREARILVNGYGPGLRNKRWETSTDAAGRFALRDLPPGKYRVSRLVLFDQLTTKGSVTTGTGTQGVRAEVRSGAMTKVTLGGSGRTVVGRLVAGAGLENRKLAFTAGGFRFLTLNEKRDDGFPGRLLVLDIERDGSFRCEDVPPGEYDLYVTVKDAAGKLDGPDVGAIQRTLTVPREQTDAGKPHDFGPLTLEPARD